MKIRLTSLISMLATTTERFDVIKFIMLNTFKYSILYLILGL